MKLLHPLRITGALIVLLALVFLLIILLFATESALNVWARLREAPAWVGAGWLALVVAIAGAGLVLAWRLVFGRRRRREAEGADRVLDESGIEARLERAGTEGIEVTAAAEEMAERQRRLKEQRVYVAFFGEVSKGKSSLIRALAPDADTATDPRGGTTRAVAHFDWRTPGGDLIRLADVPGSHEAEGDLDEQARKEALRAHAVVFVCDGDLTGAEWKLLRELLAFEKPLVVALNKIDRYDEGELALIRKRLEERLEERAAVVPVQAAGENARTGALAHALQSCLDANQEALERLRDSAVFRLADEQLSRAEAEHRARESEKIVRRYSRRAVVGALAAVTPGSDLVIQGALAAALLKELARLHEVPVRQLDLDRFLELAGGRLRKTTSIVLAVSGNALKAFPGVGTITGGLMHAVAYGMIFQSLGTAAARTMATRGELRPLPAAQAFEDDLRDTLSTRAKRFAAVALDETRKR